jgi:hypothetical protein
VSPKRRAFAKRLAYEALEERRLLAVTLTRTDDVLTIAITAGGEQDVTVTVSGINYQVDGVNAADATIVNVKQTRITGDTGEQAERRLLRRWCSRSSRSRCLLTIESTPR